MKLDIASGNRKTEGFIGIDIAEIPGVDMVHDLEKYPWPIDSESVDEAICSHYLEHVHDMFKFFDECYRILKPGAKILIICPYWNTMRAFQDPTHKNFISENTFLYCIRSWRESRGIGHYQISCNFDSSVEFDLSGEWSNRTKEVQQFAIRHYCNVVQNIRATLTKR